MKDDVASILKAEGIDYDIQSSYANKGLKREKAFYKNLKIKFLQLSKGWRYRIGKIKSSYWAYYSTSGVIESK